MNDQISSHWIRLAVTPCTISSWRSAQTLPASISSFATVLKLTSASRAVARMDWPSQSMFRIKDRVFRGSLFMSLIYELRCLASGVLFLFAQMPPSSDFRLALRPY